jgi:fatty acid desaturase
MISEERRAEIEAKHTTDPIWQWFNRASQAYWGFAGRVAGYFSQALGRVRSTNPFVGIARLTFVFVAGFIIVLPLYLVFGPFVQIVIVIIAVIWTCLAGVLGWLRPSAAQSAESTAQEQHAAQKPKSEKVSNKLKEVGTWLLAARGESRACFSRDR